MKRERRQFDRIGYPDNFRPKLVVGESKDIEEHREKEYNVMDICVRGIKFTSEEEMSGFSPSSKVEVQITFSDGELLVVNGEVLRCNENQVVIYPSREIPFPRIIKEKEFAKNLCHLGYSQESDVPTN